MVEVIEFKRGNIDYIASVGVSTEGITELTVKTVNPIERGLKRIWYWVELHPLGSKEDRKGRLVYIETIWETALLDPNGDIIEDTVKSIKMQTNLFDILTFALGFGVPILKHMLNGFIRDTLGFNNQRLFDQTGSVIVYPDEDLELPPTNDYHVTD